VEERVRLIAAIAIGLIVIGLILPAAYAPGNAIHRRAGHASNAHGARLLRDGILSFFISGQVRKPGTTEDYFPISEDPRHHYYPSHRKLTLTALLSRPASFGLLYTVMLCGVLMPSLLIFFNANPHYVGIDVH
jgi:hypothetical protein